MSRYKKYVVVASMLFLCACGAVPALAHAVRAVGRPPMGVVTERKQGSHVVIGDEPHVAS